MNQVGMNEFFVNGLINDKNSKLHPNLIILPSRVNFYSKKIKFSKICFRLTCKKCQMITKITTEPSQIPKCQEVTTGPLQIQKCWFQKWHNRHALSITDVYTIWALCYVLLYSFSPLLFSFENFLFVTKAN